jgi:primosomal protein N' (replication factor Y)
VFKCPHCDVSLKEHNSKTVNAKLVCHYCGYEIARPKVCPECNSPFIAGFGTGTQKVESEIKKEFPDARVIRMDTDTTKRKNSHEKIVDSFANGQADILVGTQMIVKGHDFPNVTLVGAIAADTTLFDNDYMAAEKTFDLLTQAAGRAGRSDKGGEVVIQTYRPDDYCIQAAANQDYDEFFEEEKAYREMLCYPPIYNMLVIFMECEDEELLGKYSDFIKAIIDKQSKDNKELRVIGPCEANIYKMDDNYRKVIYLKSKSLDELIMVKDTVESILDNETDFEKCFVSFDFNPLKTY